MSCSVVWELFGKIMFAICRFGVKASSRTVECCKIKFCVVLTGMCVGIVGSGMVQVKFGKVEVLCC